MQERRLIFCEPLALLAGEGSARDSGKCKCKGKCVGEEGSWGRGSGGREGVKLAATRTPATASGVNIEENRWAAWRWGQDTSQVLCSCVLVTQAEIFCVPLALLCACFVEGREKARTCERQCILSLSSSASARCVGWERAVGFRILRLFRIVGNSVCAPGGMECGL